MSEQTPIRERARDFFAALQDDICAALERFDGRALFREDLWRRDGGGGGRTRVMEEGAVFEKAGVNFSEVFGYLDEAFAAKLPVGEGSQFFATGVSLVLHPLNPHVPTVHANFRYLERGSGGWFGGGTDLTPCYPVLKDVIHFHRTLKEACDRFDPSFYPRFKRWCDDYFFIKHRNETRGVGGIFFDYLTGEREGPLLDADDDKQKGDRGIEFIFEFVQAAGRAFLPAYMPIAERHIDDPFTEREREFQLIRRGRYVEFNLVYDRGTHFGLETRGRTESILMSLPPLARWAYDYRPEAGTREAEAWDYFRPRDWLEIETTDEHR
ncbi:MAG TPA: oxygen-dependent coproporphyrinogen oxidase [Blastocatellia bacterium]|nr:oxygen-dependent coproporphyrinogen oxidase [Blastocatellia bacterium]